MIQFISERIEFLWIIPVVAFAFFIFMIQLLAQKKEDRHDLSKEVAQFNTGIHSPEPASSEQGSDRLSQLERAIASVTDSISAQQRAIEQFHRDNTSYTGEINDLKHKLRELYKEYDIILSENYSLRAKVKKLQDSREETNEEQEASIPSTQALPPEVSPDPKFSSKVDLKLYEDTRTLNLAFLDDTSEVDLSDLSRRSDIK